MQSDFFYSINFNPVHKESVNDLFQNFACACWYQMSMKSKLVDNERMLSKFYARVPRPASNHVAWVALKVSSLWSKLASRDQEVALLCCGHTRADSGPESLMFPQLLHRSQHDTAAMHGPNGRQAVRVGMVHTL